MYCSREKSYIFLFVVMDGGCVCVCMCKYRIQWTAIAGRIKSKLSAVFILANIDNNVAILYMNNLHCTCTHTHTHIGIMPMHRTGGGLKVCTHRFLFYTHTLCNTFTFSLLLSPLSYKVTLSLSPPLLLYLSIV